MTVDSLARGKARGLATAIVAAIAFGFLATGLFGTGATSASAPKAADPRVHARTEVAASLIDTTPLTTKSDRSPTQRAASTTTSTMPTTTSTIAATTTTVAPACNTNLASTIAIPSQITQLITVEVSRYTVTAATLTAWQRTDSCWSVAVGPFHAVVGYRGVSTHKHEGDDATPAGMFSFKPTMYGNAPNPGVRYAYHRLVCGDWWDEDPSSRDYNLFEHVRCATDPAFNNGSSEALWTETQSYPSFAVINYNPARTPGRGSAIFLHAYGGTPTHGCVALHRTDLNRVLDWMNPNDSPRIDIGTPRTISLY